MLTGTAFRRMVMSLLETGRRTMTVFNVRANKKSNAMLVFILFVENLVSYLCCCFAKVLPSHFTESKDVPSVSVHSCVNSWSFPAALSVLVFHVPMMMSSLPRIFGDAPVAYLTTPSCWTVVGAVLVDPGGD